MNFTCGAALAALAAAASRLSPSSAAIASVIRLRWPSCGTISLSCELLSAGRSGTAMFAKFILYMPIWIASSHSSTVSADFGKLPAAP